MSDVPRSRGGYVVKELPKNAAGKIQKSALKPAMALRSNQT